MVAVLRRLESVLRLPQTRDVVLLREVLAQGSDTNDPSTRVVLDSDEYEAYRRVTDRIMATWHKGDRLASFLYRGLG